jgi:hypothetical protein
MNIQPESQQQHKKKGGRPPKADKRNRLIAVKCSTAERAIIMSKAQKSALTVSEYLRELALKGKIVMRNQALPREVLDYTATLNHLAANLNQIAKKRNGIEELSVEERTGLRVQSDEVRKLAQEIKSYLR